MKDGKKTKARNMVFKALKLVEKESKGLRLEDVFNKAMQNIKPRIEVKSKRIGGANYAVPIPVGETRGNALAIRWLIEACRSRSGKSFAEILSEEILHAYNNTGAAIKKKENVEKMAEANKAFAQFKW